MAPSSLRRLASDHAALRRQPLPPHYLFPPDIECASMPDDLTQLVILLAGPEGTPYSAGLWRLHFRMPEDYPASPPKASFRTRIWHPNVEELSGSICLDTLKRDWQPTLTLKDILITISCLLIQPNPDSALNSAAGALLQDNYEAFARQAKLMTSIHASTPISMAAAVQEAKHRGEDALPKQLSDKSCFLSNSRRPLNKPSRSALNKSFTRVSQELCEISAAGPPEYADENAEVSPLENFGSPPLPSPTPQMSTSRINSGKRSHENTSDEVGVVTSLEGEDFAIVPAESLRKDDQEPGEPLKKSPKLVERKEEDTLQSNPMVHDGISLALREQELAEAGNKEKEKLAWHDEPHPLAEVAKPHLTASATVLKPPNPRKAVFPGAPSRKGPRIGIRRL